MRQSLIYLWVLSFGLLRVCMAEVPEGLEKGIRQQYAEARVLTATSCKLGKDKETSYGVLIQGKMPSDENKLKHPLQALVVIESKDGWKITEVPKSGTYSKGGFSDFLNDYWDRTKGYRGNFEALCVDLQSHKSISVRANGEFIGSFAAKKPAPGEMHLCFSADTVYNSWVCLAPNPDTKKVEPSFIQLNAD